MKLLIKDVQTFLPNGTVEKKNILIDKNIILDVVDKVPEDFKADKLINGEKKFAIPGLINAHTHAAMTLLRSYADDMALMPWLTEKIWPIEDKMSADDLYWGTMLAAIEMIKSGATTFADMYGPFVDEVVKATIDSGLRGVIARGIVAVAPGADEKLADSERLFKTYNNAQNGRIKIMLSPHSLYTCPPDFLKKMASIANKLGADIHTHMSETEGEVKDCIKNYGKRPFSHVASTGLFENATLAAHCVHVNDEDIEIMKKYNIRAVHCPGSNLKLASGVAPITKLLKNNITVALGTDGASSNNNLDMLEEMRLAALIGKVEANDPEAIPALTAVKMATEFGASAVGINDIGKIESGYKADIVLYDISGANFRPTYNLTSLLVYSGNAGDTDTVVVDGKILMENKELTTIDEEKVYSEVEKAVDRLMK